MEDQTNNNIEETTVSSSQEGKSRIYFVILMLVLLIGGGLVGYYILEQQKFLDNEIDRLVIGDQDRTERKAIRAMTEKIAMMEEKGDKLVEGDWDKYMVGGYFFAPFPLGWHSLIEQEGEGVYTVALDADPVVRTEGGHFDPITFSYRPSEVDEELERDEESIFVASSGQQYYVTMSEKTEDGAWYESSITYEAILPDATGKEYYQKIQLLLEHSALADIGSEDYMEQFNKLNTLEIE